MQLVIAAITTEPWSSVQRTPAVVTSTAVGLLLLDPDRGVAALAR